MKSIPSILLASVLIAGFTSSCTVTRVDSREGPARIESKGFVNGHAALGILAENQLLHMDVFDGTSRGAQFEFGLWKLFRLELGIAGASASVGPLHAGLGVLSYKPRVPRMTSQGLDSKAEEVRPKAKACCEQEACEEIAEVEFEEEVAAEEATFVFTESSDDSNVEVIPVFEVDPAEVTKE